MSNVKELLNQKNVNAVYDILESQSYINDVLESDALGILNGTYQPGNNGDVEEAFKLNIRVIMNAFSAAIKPYGFVLPKMIFNVYAFVNEEDSETVKSITIAARTHINKEITVKSRLKSSYSSVLKASYAAFIKNYLADVFNAYAAVENIEAINGVIDMIKEQADAPVPFNLGVRFVESNAPIVSITPDEVIFNVNAYGALVQAPKTGLKSVIDLARQNEIAIEKQLAKEAADAEAAKEAEAKALEEAKLAEENDEKPADVDTLLENLAVSFTNETEEVKPTAEELAARKEEGIAKFNTILLQNKVDKFVDSLLGTWLASANPLEFIRSYNDEFMSIVAGRTTKGRCHKVLPLIKDSATLTTSALKLRKSGKSLQVMGDGEDKTAKILAKIGDEIVTVYPEFNVQTLALV